jgi:hypothetical protein
MAGNDYQQGFRSVTNFGFGGQESASKPPQAICKTQPPKPKKPRHFLTEDSLYNLCLHNSLFSLMEHFGLEKISFGVDAKIF